MPLLQWLASSPSCRSLHTTDALPALSSEEMQEAAPLGPSVLSFHFPVENRIASSAEAIFLGISLSFAKETDLHF